MPTEFEQVVKALNISPEEYAGSNLRCGIRRHRINHNFTKSEAIQPLIFFPSSVPAFSCFGRVHPQAD